MTVFAMPYIEQSIEMRKKMNNALIILAEKGNLDVLKYLIGLKRSYIKPLHKVRKKTHTHKKNKQANKQTNK
jgi:hypothetical protein